MNKILKSNLEVIYDTFSEYTLKDPKSVGCFDFGPTDEELEGISKNLKDIPDQILGSMEFFGEGWDSWGNKNEIKYFLPRLFEYIANDISRLGDAGTFSFFKYKLAKCLRPHNKDWKEDEKEAIRNFISNLVAFHFCNTNEIADLIEAALAVGITPESLYVLWEQNAGDKAEKIKYLENEYQTSANEVDSVKIKQRGYYENTDEISEFLRLAFGLKDF